MHAYLSWHEQTISDFSEKNIDDWYNRGYLFTRTGRGALYETRSVRVDLGAFELSSENRRVLRKTENVKMEVIPLPHQAYDWHIHKLGSGFYTRKFGEKTFSANKIKELLTDEGKSNFNCLMKFSVDNMAVGYAICFMNKNILHYAYPFYDLDSTIPNLGIGMMTRVLAWAKENGKKYVYLGSAKDSAALYKTQFTGFEWWDGEGWSGDIENLKKTIYV